MILTIISHTPHYLSDNEIVGWGPTISEINNLTNLFSKIYHVAPLYKEESPESSLPYNSKKIIYVPIEPSGGNGIIKKLKIFLKMFNNLVRIHNSCNLSDWVHFRAPTNLGLYVLPYLLIIRKKKYWIKYAGNWNQTNAPLSYRLQKFWLNNVVKKSKVTINGKWPNQKKHLLSFENPCLSKNELIHSRKQILHKNYLGLLDICFVGSLARTKGVGYVISALKNIEDLSSIKSVYIVGDGPDKKKYETEAKSIKNIPIVFTGALSRNDLNLIYSKCQILILPSDSEGFPKVISESAAYGCVSIVSDVGSIKHYLNKANGILLKKSNADGVSSALIYLLKNRTVLKKLANNCYELSRKFTYERYNERIKNMILNQ